MTATRPCPSRARASGPTRPIPGSELVVVEGAPHGFNVSHAAEFNRALIDFLAR